MAVCSCSQLRGVIRGELRRFAHQARDPETVSKIDRSQSLSKVLRPGDWDHFKPLITIRLNDLLSQPDDYQILAVVHGANSNEQVRSKPLSVRIVKSQGINEQVFNYLKRTTSSDIFAGRDLSENQGMLSALEAVANEFVDSAYSDYASFTLGEFYFYSNENARAKLYLDRLAGKADFVFADKVLDYGKKLAQRDIKKH